MTNIIIYFDDTRFEDEVKESVNVVLDTFQRAKDEMVVFHTRRGGAVVFNTAKIQRMLITEGGGEND